MPDSRPAAARAAALLALSLLAGAAAPAAADLLLNEVLYDPDGIDEGAEFVEIWNPDPAPRPLEGVVLESGDGSRSGAWTVVWSGTAGDTVSPGVPYLVRGGALAAPLQNGPDAVRLRRGEAVLDLLGYGALEEGGPYEGAPAADAPSGQSLARREDGADTGVNADDWSPEPIPTPGRANRPELAVVFLPGGLALDPAVPWPGESVRATLRAWNRGRRAVTPAEWGLELERMPLEEPADSAGAGPRPAVPIAAPDGIALAPGESASVSVGFVAPPGRALLALRARVAGRGEAAGAIADTALARTRVGGGPAIVGEFACRGSAGEWIEIETVEPLEDLGGLLVADRAGAAVRIDRGPAPRAAAAGERFVLAESPADLRARFALPESALLALQGAWPTLNDSDGDDGLADVVRLFLDDGTPCDAVGYSRDYAVRGGSVERLGPELSSAARGTWGESIDPAGGTPGRPNSLRASRGGGGRRGSLLAVAVRRVLRRADGAVEPAILRLTREAGGRRLRIEVRDLLGRPRRLLVDGQRFAGEAAFAWDGRDDRGEAVPPGIYTVRAQAEAEGGLPPGATSIGLTVAAEAAR